MQTRELVLVILLWATIGMLSLANLTLILSYLSLGRTYLIVRIVLFLLLLAGVCGLYIAARRGYYRTAAYGLLTCYFAVATAMVAAWGLDLASGILVYGLVITLAGVLLGARHSLYMTGYVVATLFLMYYLADMGVIHPDRYWAANTPAFSDIIGFALILAIQAVVSWIFNLRMERALKQALRAEDKLTRQKALLEIKVAERTRELQTAQLEKTQQVYKFAELGQLSMGLLHELANNLTTLNFDIEELSGHDRSQQLDRVKKGVAHIEASIGQVRSQLQGEAEVIGFNLHDELQKVVEALTYKAQHHSVTLVLEPLAKRQRAAYQGDPVRFRQMATNIISNGIDAYDEAVIPGQNRTVTISVATKKGSAAVTVSDNGRGIPAAKQEAVFEPFNGSNPNGMGLGLYIARRIAEQAFDGTITLESKGQPTTFIIYMAEHVDAE